MRSGRRLIAGLAAGTVCLSTPLAHAQTVDRQVLRAGLIDRLPGYQPRTLRFGTTTVATDLGFETRYDSNIYAVSRAPIDDVIFILTPRVLVDGVYDDLKLHGEVFGDIRQYLHNDTESRADYGGAASGSYTLDRRNDLLAGVRAQRFTESRNDPEANVNRTLTPRKIDAVSGNAGLKLQRNRFDFLLSGEIQHLDYQLPEDAERSLMTAQVSLNAAVTVAPQIALFVRPYVNRRDFDLAVDRNGIDRDATTLGVLGGVRLSINERLTGEIGVGGFRANPDDVSLRSFSGFSANADVTWSPRPRTTVTLRGFSGDVATVRAGASGRIDQRVSLRIDQEVRHNLLLDATIGYQNTSYRGVPADLRTASVAARAEYLVTRGIGLFVDTSYTRRRATRPTDGFNRGYIGLGIRLRH